MLSCMGYLGTVKVFDGWLLSFFVIIVSLRKAFSLKFLISIDCQIIVPFPQGFGALH